MSLDASRVILGTYGQVFIDGNWQANFNHLEAKVEVQKKELNLSGDSWVRHKLGAKKGTGTVSGFKVTSFMLEKGFTKFEIISKLADPESYGFERVRLVNVIPDRLQLANWTAGEEVKEEISFTFEGYELLDPIKA
ncbi:MULTISPECIES: phage tail tube protein [Paenibacillus]|uniref:Phage portal protein n=2 Tax=Paenibacillus TaxID=44249 RepID=A0A161URL9_9BACL|nr:MULTISPECIES: phage tail tube protein [Paenibacillus]KZE80311.1 phage portal protein [Paenibacillus elgii]MBU7316244.1 phage tail tube protein [Paenibacillus oleatilyticus]MCP1307794.1 phage tail tube protein [Paenibacillus tyrfis]PUA40775.1 phage portal protein [Paenibacillus elgii]GMX60837.1 phage tail tube protein [Paenibacillus elgii]